MDVKLQQGKDTLTDGARPRERDACSRAELSDWVGERLGQWQQAELRLARSFPACRGLNHQQLEDVYQETVLALLARPYASEEHLRNALRQGLKHRALNHHRDERRRGEILAQTKPGMYATAEARQEGSGPEPAAVARQDRLVVAEFLAELTATEQRVFWLQAEGMRYRAIATALAIDVNVARNASRACERKRERFQLLYDTGRLCGYRSETIIALQAGKATSRQLATLALAHLESCQHCRSEHRTSARALRARFRDQAAALLPIPALARRLGWLTRIDIRARALLHRIVPNIATPGPAPAREATDRKSVG